MKILKKAVKFVVITCVFLFVGIIAFQVYSYNTQKEEEKAISQKEEVLSDLLFRYNIQMNEYYSYAFSEDENLAKVGEEAYLRAEEIAIEYDQNYAKIYGGKSSDEQVRLCAKYNLEVAPLLAKLTSATTTDC